LKCLRFEERPTARRIGSATRSSPNENEHLSQGDNRIRLLRISLLTLALSVFGASTSSAVRVDMSAPDFGSAVTVGARLVHLAFETVGLGVGGLDFDPFYGSTLRLDNFADLPLGLGAGDSVAVVPVPEPTTALLVGLSWEHPGRVAGALLCFEPSTVQRAGWGRAGADGRGGRSTFSRCSLRRGL
jgi:hypothetical protein